MEAKIMWEYVVPAFVFSLSLISYGFYMYVRETAVVKGKVFEADKYPAVDVEIRIGRTITYTDALGQFQFLDVPFGKHVMSVRRGAIVKERPIQIRKSSTVLYETLG
jgi:hypothetical protein